MSIVVVSKSITVTKIEFDVAEPIKIESPNPLMRNDFLNQPGQQSITRPTFFCHTWGEGKVNTTWTGTAVVEATFQPENVSRAYEVATTHRTRRKGKCIEAEIGLNNQTFSQDDAEETALARADPEGDVSLVVGNTLESASGYEVPEFVDLAGSLVSVVGEEGGEALYASLSVHGMIPEALSSQDLFLSFDFLVLDPSVGPMEGSALRGGVGAPLCGSAPDRVRPLRGRALGSSV